MQNETDPANERARKMAARQERFNAVGMQISSDLDLFEALSITDPDEQAVFADHLQRALFLALTDDFVIHVFDGIRDLRNPYMETVKKLQSEPRARLLAYHIVESEIVPHVLAESIVSYVEGSEPVTMHIVSPTEDLRRRLNAVFTKTPAVRL